MNKPLLFLILNRSKQRINKGFSLFEVSLSILISSAFLMGTLQAMTINAVLQVKSERQAQANFLIQQDIEIIQATASNMSLEYYKKTDIKPILNPNNYQDNYLCRGPKRRSKDTRFGADLVKELDRRLSKDIKPNGDDDKSTESKPAIKDLNKVFSGAEDFEQFKTDDNGNVVFNNGTKRPELKTNPDPKKVVVQIVMNGSDDESDPNFENNLLNQNYRMVRLMTVDKSTRYDVLQVYYRVGKPYPEQGGEDRDGDNLRDDEAGRISIIAENYTEVIPAAVAECGLPQRK
ncbi:hypothetical protein WH8501_25735 [Crocosphaera watsonii WH 8501]|uniref:Uncharacterized protein n=6 Tax=Crocosphaera watsonii TaxID=263511 RepID=Q4C6L7_CROWT|nr:MULTISPECIES: hypothetical protein [Crocosphaera]CCQ65467.1 hypothetical protein CWATWH0402_4224 [Crocosphaera watsonii WH 0402]EAM51951.1 hypothetical protein CwatDRAFT_5003 [Crocosphaera watsonii WH 8501]EHJ13747.1 hypothetical protein CWATWH0003_1571 [Crocosphaera watsonii WH 0003]MCH2247093.1 hypothetical protein [Crocosphaera sp.]NQZ63776.1 hypothetical protein [Crocosphaera sp.]